MEQKTKLGLRTVKPQSNNPVSFLNQKPNKNKHSEWAHGVAKREDAQIPHLERRGSKPTTQKHTDVQLPFTQKQLHSDQKAFEHSCVFYMVKKPICQMFCVPAYGQNT